MKILFATSSSIEYIAGDTIQFASAASMYSQIGQVDVITDSLNVTQIEKLGFSKDLNIMGIDQNTHSAKCDAISKLDRKNDYNYIFVRGEELLEHIYLYEPNLYRTKVVAYITNENLGVSRNIKLFESAKLVRFQTKQHLEFYLDKGYKGENGYVETPSIDDKSSIVDDKEYDMIYIGKIAPGWKVDKFFKIAMRYPEKKFCLVYSSIFNNMPAEHKAIIELGMESLDNIDIFFKASREECAQLLAKTRFSYCYRTNKIDNNGSREISTKLLESINANCFPVLRKTNMHVELLGEDYPYFIESIADFDFTYDQKLSIVENANPYLKTSILETVKPIFNEFKVQGQYLKTSQLSVADAIICKMNGIAILSTNPKVVSMCHQFRIRHFNCQQEVEKAHVLEVSDLSSLELGYSITEFKNIIGVPNALYEHFVNDQHLSRTYTFIDTDAEKMSLEHIYSLLNTTFEFKAKSYDDLITIYNIIGQVDCAFTKYNVITDLDVSGFNTPNITYNRKVESAISLEFNNYTVEDLLSIAKGEKCEVSLYQASDLVVVDSMYPSNENLYAHVFVHTRVNQYKKEGLKPTVALLRRTSCKVETYSFENQMVLICNEEGFGRLFGNNPRFKFGIHFVNGLIFNTLNKHNMLNPKTVWFHGADCLDEKDKEHFHDLSHPISKRAYLGRKEAMSKQRGILRRLFVNQTYQSIFVSNWLFERVSEKYNIEEKCVSVIPNSIDTERFYFEEKQVKDGEKIRFLSIMPFLLEYDQYANKVLVEAIKLAAKQPWFEQAEFSIYGRGSGFDFYMDQLSELKKQNIVAKETFLTHKEIKDLHSAHHVALFPNNQDTHGVSFYEAMSSGLVAISSNNSAKPEYCQNGVTGFLHNDMDANDLCRVMGEIVENYNQLAVLRKAGHDSVNEQFNETMITKRELKVFNR